MKVVNISVDRAEAQRYVNELNFREERIQRWESMKIVFPNVRITKGTF